MFPESRISDAGLKDILLRYFSGGVLNASRVDCLFRQGYLVVMNSDLVVATQESIEGLTNPPRDFALLRFDEEGLDLGVIRRDQVLQFTLPPCGHVLGQHE